MDFGDFSMLFTGDSGTEQRTCLMENHPALLDVDVLKASHHGLRNGVDGTVNGKSWFAVVTPAAGNPYPPPRTVPRPWAVM